MAGGQTRSFSFSITTNPHVITVDSYVPNSVGANGTRYFVRDTSWGFSAPGNHIFAYLAQYYLAVQTIYSSTTGQAWYDSGTTITVMVKDQEINEGKGTRHIFVGWSGDASGTGLTSNGILMTGPKTAVANWKAQFFLTVQSIPPNVTNLKGSGWYDSGNQAVFSAAKIVPASSNTRLSFDHWGADYAGQSPTGTILMDRPKTVEAIYHAQYLLSIQYDPTSITSEYNESRAGWFDANSNVQLGPVPSIINLSTVERLRFVGWIQNGVLSSNPSDTVVMDKALTVTLTYRTQYYVDVRSSQGSVTGSGWYDRGATAEITGRGSQSWPFSFTLTGWRLDPSTGSLTKAGDSWSLKVDRPFIVEAQWSFDYFPLLLLFGGGGIAVTALAFGIGLAYRRGAFRRTESALRSRSRSRTSAVITAMQVCSSCGNRFPKGAAFCEKCGTPMAMAAPASPSLDDKVYDYIVKHEGVVSLSVASEDLGISVEEFKEIAERLKKQGRLA